MIYEKYKEWIAETGIPRTVKDLEASKRETRLHRISDRADKSERRRAKRATMIARKRLYK